MVYDERSLSSLPDDLPVPIDDGAADHLRGAAVPAIALAATDGRAVDLSSSSRPTIVYAYPRTGRPGEPPFVDDWDSIPGARGCTPETCGFRDSNAEFDALGIGVFGLSTQPTQYQQEAADRLRLPFALLSDADLAMTATLHLPSFEIGGQVLLRRFTLLIEAGLITHVWYPVFPPDTHAAEILGWLRETATGGGR
jgi:peroxiredoxin (alkyl hydroperoxide reductase subunit C)